MTFLERLLENIAEIQFKYPLVIFLIVILLSVFFVIGALQIKTSPDLDGDPPDLEVYKIGDRIEDEFGGRESVLVFVELDDEIDSKQAPIDIRDPEIIEFLIKLEDNLLEEDKITGVQSIGSPFRVIGIPESTDEVKAIVSQIPGANTLFNKDYTATMLFAYSEIEMDDVDELTDIIKEKIDLSSKPLGVRTSVTGGPPLMSLILKLIIKDGVFTLLLSAGVIFLLLVFLKKSFVKGVLVFFPLILGVGWTMGTMGWLGIEITMATVGLGAILLGLGVEYSIFIFERYFEEKEKNSDLDALKIALSKVGYSIIGSGSTTVVGFLALTLSISSMLADLGLALAIGIGYSLLIAVLINPAIIILYERITERFKNAKNS
ncbi:MAG: MMPL family transporter [Nanoarchaeota archaeon]|nr:MMPL family transporter [Nanoarchaeota archaeon]